MKKYLLLLLALPLALIPATAAFADVASDITPMPGSSWLDDTAQSSGTFDCLTGSHMAIMVHDPGDLNLSGVAVPAGTTFICVNTSMSVGPQYGAGLQDLTFQAWATPWMWHVNDDGSLTYLTHQQFTGTVTMFGIDAIHGYTHTDGLIQNGGVNVHQDFPPSTTDYLTSMGVTIDPSYMTFDTAVAPTCTNGATDYPTCTPPASGGTMTPPADGTVVTNRDAKLIGMAIAILVGYNIVKAFHYRSNT